MEKKLYQLTESDITLLIAFVSQSEVYCTHIDDLDPETFHKTYGMTVKQARRKGDNVTKKLVRQREVLIAASKAR